MLRACILIGRFPPEHIGGAELQAEELARRLSQNNSITVLTRGSSGKPREETRDGFTIHRTIAGNFPLLRTLLDFAGGLYYLRKRRMDFDVLLCYQPFSGGLLGVLARRLTGIPAVVWVRGKGEMSFSSSSKRRRFSLPAVRNADLVLVQSARMRDLLFEDVAAVSGLEEAKRIAKKIIVIPNIVRLSPLRGVPEGRAVLFVGRLVKEKAVGDLLLAARKVGGFEILVAGDGPERENLVHEASGLNVRFLGRVKPDEIANVLKEARVLVLPSRSGEGFPNVIIEAMSMGVPVVATDVGGTRDVVEHGVTGFLVKPGDVDGIAGCLKRMLFDNELWSLMSENAIREARKYDWEVIVPRIEETLARVVRQKFQEIG